MADSFPFPLPEAAMSGDAIIGSRMYWTDTVTGAIDEGWEVTNLTTNTVSYLDMLGNTKTTGANEVRSREPVRIALTAGILTLTAATSTALPAVPAAAAYAELQVRQAVIFALDGNAPDLATDKGFRVPPNTIVTLESRDEVEKFRGLMFVGGDIHYQYYNTAPVSNTVDPA